MITKGYERRYKTVHLYWQALIPLVFAGGLAVGSQKTSFDRWEPAIQAFEEADRQSFPEPGQALFIGSSSIRLWDLQRSFPGLQTLNRGFGGSQIEDSTHFADRVVIPYKPAAIVLYAGDNDIAAGNTPAQVTEDFRRFVARIRDSLPAIPIFYISIKPSVARLHLMDQMRDANQLIEEWSEDTEGVEFIDVFGPMLNSEGKPRQELFVEDGLHLNQDGYRLWSLILSPYLQQWRQPEFAAEDWKLVWSDEFEYEGLPDPQKWDYEVGYVRNKEKQYYTVNRAENARVEGGHLVIQARKESYRGFEYTSASVITKGKAAWTYGRFEIRARLPVGRGTWPAIWMLGTNIDEVGWPACGEIDVMENVGFDPDAIHANIHTEAYNHVKRTNKGGRITIENPHRDFHVYALEWSPDRMEFFVDDSRYFVFANENTGWEAWPFDKPFYLILNLAAGGSWGGQKGIDDSIFPQTYLIDYVRVYERAG